MARALMAKIGSTHVTSVTTELTSNIGGRISYSYNQYVLVFKSSEVSIIVRMEDLSLERFEPRDVWFVRFC